MTINQANELLKNVNCSQAELLDCLELLCKEYGYVKGVIKAGFRNSESGKKTLAEIQDLINQLKQKLKLP